MGPEEIRGVQHLFRRRPNYGGYDAHTSKRKAQLAAATKKRAKNNWPHVAGIQQRYRWSAMPAGLEKRFWSDEEVGILFNPQLTQREKAFLLKRSIPSISCKMQTLKRQMAKKTKRGAGNVAAAKRAMACSNFGVQS